MRIPYLILMMNGMNQYNQIRVIGEGSTCQVILASNSQGNLYAIKEINIKNLPDDLLKMIKQEAKLLSRIDHPNIIRLKQAFQTPEHKYCMVLEYASGTKLNNFGGNLESRLLFNGQIEFQEETIVNWLCQICLGLKHLHERGIIHRDIKTQNVFLNSKNRIKIGDLGISKELKGHKDYTKSFVGTPYYLPPEVIGGSSYTNKFDMWSLGVLLYELCNRTVPFPGTSFNDVASNILSGEYKPISPSYSKELKSIIMSLLCSNPDLRPSAFDILNLKFSRIAINKFLSQENKGELHKTKVKHVHFEEKTEKKKNLETGFEQWY